MISERFASKYKFTRETIDRAIAKQENWAEALDFPDHITPLNIHGVCMIHGKKFTDKRGSFQMMWMLSDIKTITGKDIHFRQSNHSRTLPKERPILRGLHA
jgi:dTDP-4-dehydrorhamnose 3,5-epimerase-like enzyme